MHEGIYAFIRQNFVDADMRIAIILSFPSSNILILFVHAVEQRIETPPFPFGNINPSSVSFVSEHLVQLSIEGNRNLISYFLNGSIFQTFISS